MPKKKTKSKNDEEEREGRPSNQLTLGDYLFAGTGLTGASTSSSNEETSTIEPSELVENDSKKCLFICRTKKGGVPVKVENRSSGKKVTIIEHVLGDYKLLLQDFKNMFGTGGLYRDGNIELQGDLKVKVSKYLNDNKHLLKPYGTEPPKV